MKYRIVKTYWRDDSNAKIQHEYFIEYLDYKYLWSRKKTWIKYTIRICYYECYNEVITFNKLSKAKEYLENLKKLIPENKIIK